MFVGAEKNLSVKKPTIERNELQPQHDFIVDRSHVEQEINEKQKEKKNGK